MKLTLSSPAAPWAHKMPRIPASFFLSIAGLLIILRLLLLGCSNYTFDTTKAAPPGININYRPSGGIIISMQSPLHLGHIHAPAKNEQDRLKP